MKKIEDRKTLVFIVDVKVSKQQIKQAVKRLYDTNVAKANPLIRPDKEKVSVQPASPYDALDVANKMGIMYTEDSWLIPNAHLSHKPNKQQITNHCKLKT